MPISRRHLLGSAAAGALLPTEVLAGRSTGTSAGEAGEPPFLHGVASGDPGTTSVVLWTRITPLDPDEVVEVRWTVYRDPGLTRRVAGGRVRTGPWRDWTAKVVPDGLSPGATYHYRFETSRGRSQVGRTRTLPASGTRTTRLAFTSCSNYPYGFFNVYRCIAERSDLDAVLHLGDYIYEYANGIYGDGRPLNRVPAPNRELIELDDYRTRYAQYRTDPDLQALHRRHPMIAVWDDHESANDAWHGGAENHQPPEGPWPRRRDAAIRAWQEWMPTREGVPSSRTRIWRSFRFGDAAHLIMLDTRLYGRDRQAGSAADLATLADPGRSLLGRAQEAWLFDELGRARHDAVPWRLVGQQVMFGQLGGFEGQPIFNPDQWDGYPLARRRILDHLAQQGIDDVAILSGDVHSSWAMDIATDPFDPGTYDPGTGRGSRAVELVTPSVTSPAATDAEDGRQQARAALAAHPHMRYVDLLEKGYVLLDIDPERLQAEFWHVETIGRRSDAERLAATFTTGRGANHLERIASSPSAGPA